MSHGTSDQPTAPARATRKDVAQRAEVSPAAVTHILAGRGERMGFRPETIARVIDAAQQLNYQPHAAATLLHGGQPAVIAMLLGADSRGTARHDQLHAAQQRGYFLLPFLAAAAPEESANSPASDSDRETDRGDESPLLKLSGTGLHAAELGEAELNIAAATRLTKRVPLAGLVGPHYLEQVARRAGIAYAASLEQLLDTLGRLAE